METQPSLDPRINPWRRGDVCTRNFQRVGFVVNCAREFVEVRWTEGGGIEKVPADQVDDLLRVAHADGPAPNGGRTNLQALQSLEALDAMRDALAHRTFKNAQERHEADNLVRRAFATDICHWDERHRAELLTLVVKPEQVSLFFKIRDRMHRLICKRSRALPQ